MVDYVEQLSEQLGETDNVDFPQLRHEATARYQQLQEMAQPVMKVIEDPEAVTKLRSGGDREKNLEMLKSEYNVGDHQERLMIDFPRPRQCAVPLRSISIHSWSIWRRRQLLIPFPSLFSFARPQYLRSLG
jgi:hypothetical protein